MKVNSSNRTIFFISLFLMAFFLVGLVRECVFRYSYKVKKTTYAVYDGMYSAMRGGTGRYLFLTEGKQCIGLGDYNEGYLVGETFYMEYDSLDVKKYNIYNTKPIFLLDIDIDTTIGLLTSRPKFMHPYFKFSYTVNNKSYERIQFVEDSIKTLFKHGESVKVLYRREKPEFAIMVYGKISNIIIE